MQHTPLIRNLRSALGGENVISAPSELVVYDCDAFTLSRNPPYAVVFPQSTEQVADAVKICNQHNVSIVPRGAGTGLAGGCTPLQSSVVVMLTRMNRVVEIDIRNRWAVVEPGVYNSQLEKSLNGTGYLFIAKPSTQGSSTIGGNVVTNASGQNSLKYGTAVNHVLGLEAVLSDGSVIQLGPLDDPASLDLIGLLAGSEGTLAIVTKIWLRLTPNPQGYRTIRAIFPSINDAINTVTQILVANILPSAIELLDQGILSTLNESFGLGLPPDAAAMLILDIDSPIVGQDRKQGQIVLQCNKNNAKDVQTASVVEDRDMLWKCRKLAIPAAGRISPTYLIEDCVVPRTRVAQMLEKIAEIGQKHEVRIMSVAHAADGNIHPVILYDDRDPKSVARALAASRELLEQSIALGGSISGEHGIGTKKKDLMLKQFQSADLEAFNHVRYSFDSLCIFNPEKIISH